VRRAIVLVGIAACGGATAARPRDDLDAPRARTLERGFTLAWRGARIGDAREREAWDAGGVTLERHESIRVRRAGALAITETSIAIHADRALVADRVTWREEHSDGPTRMGRATRELDGWRIELDGEAARRAGGDAVPEELVPIVVRERGAFDGEVMLTGRGFAVAHAEIVVRRPSSVVRIRVDGAELSATVTLDQNGDPLRIAASDGVVAARADDATIAQPFDPPEVVDGAAIALDRAAPADRSPITIVLHGVTRAPPPAMIGQSIAADGDTWTITLAPIDARDDQLRSLAHAIFAADDGDCNAHAVAFASRASVPAKLVTGWRVDGARLVRHRWALAQIGDRWIPIDPSYDEAPAAPRLIGLAITDDTAAGLALGDLAFSGTDGATATLPAR